MREFEAIKRHYGDRCAERSKVPLINHVTEGLVVLDAIGASEWAKRAFCLHPLVQADEDFEENLDGLSPFDPLVVALAVEYRSVANAYLSQSPEKEPSEIRLSPLRDVNDMLIADKVQNRKDFLIHHRGTHPRSQRLAGYFSRWLEALGIQHDRYEELAALIGAGDPVAPECPPMAPSGGEQHRGVTT